MDNFFVYEDANRPFEICISPKEDTNFYEDMINEGCAMHIVEFPNDEAQIKYKYTYVLIESDNNGYEFTYISRKQAQTLVHN